MKAMMWVLCLCLLSGVTMLGEEDPKQETTMTVTREPKGKMTVTVKGAWDVRVDPLGGGEGRLRMIVEARSDHTSLRATCVSPISIEVTGVVLTGVIPKNNGKGFKDDFGHSYELEAGASLPEKVKDPLILTGKITWGVEGIAFRFHEKKSTWVRVISE